MRPGQPAAHFFCAFVEKRVRKEMEITADGSARRPCIELPQRWRPRPYQAALWRYLQAGGTRAIAVWHRRAGKDEVALHATGLAAQRRVGTYWHMLPEAAQARKAVWDAVNPHSGRRRIDEAFPRAIRAATRETDMLIRLRSGSTWQVVGSDNYDSLVGSPPVGIVFSEYALANPQAWAYFRPILAENGGWALFISTPRGRNHLATFFDQHKDDPGWFVEKLSVEQTGIFTPEQLAHEQREYVAEFGESDGDARYRQEYLCDFHAAIVGAYYGPEMNRAEADGRITGVPYRPDRPVVTAWDLGISDSTAIWFAQWCGRELHVIDYLENSGAGLDWYAKALRERGYVYEEALLPHDAGAREIGSGKSREETLRALGIKCRVLPAHALMDGINAARVLLPQCWFDAVKCKQGLAALRQYRREWDERRKVFHDRPLHDFASHGADAFRYLAQGIRPPRGKPPRNIQPDVSHLA
jgi:hypothetical protein